MSMPHTESPYTVEDLLALPDDGNRYELVHGELLVTPSPRQVHQIILAELHFAFAKFLKERPELGRVFFAPADITWGPDTLVQPDLFVVKPDQVTGDWKDCQQLLLAIEVLSPSSSRADRVIKRRLYQEQDVTEYWIVDIDARLVETWRPDDERPAVEADRVTWHPIPDADPLIIELADLFAALPGNEGG